MGQPTGSVLAGLTGFCLFSGQSFCLSLGRLRICVEEGTSGACCLSADDGGGGGPTHLVNVTSDNLLRSGPTPRSAAGSLPAAMAANPLTALSICFPTTCPASLVETPVLIIVSNNSFSLAAIIVSCSNSSASIS